MVKQKITKNEKRETQKEKNSVPKNNQKTQKTSSKVFNVSKFEKKYKEHLQDENLNGLSDLQKVFHKKLEGSKFRILNEQLYTTTGSEAQKMFKEDPSLYEVVSFY